MKRHLPTWPLPWPAVSGPAPPPAPAPPAALASLPSAVDISYSSPPRVPIRSRQPSLDANTLLTAGSRLTLEPPAPGRFFPPPPGPVATPPPPPPTAAAEAARACVCTVAVRRERVLKSSRAAQWLYDPRGNTKKKKETSQCRISNSQHKYLLVLLACLPPGNVSILCSMSLTVGHS